MKYIYAALLLHASSQTIDEAKIRKVLSASGTDIDEARVKALVASLSEVDIEEAIKTAPGIAVAPIAQVEDELSKEKEEEEEEKEEEKEEEAIAGLGALFQ